MYYEKGSITDRAVRGHMGDPDFWGDKPAPVSSPVPVPVSVHHKPALRLVRLEVEPDIRKAEEDDHGQLQCC